MVNKNYVLTRISEVKMNKKKIIAETIFEQLVDLFAGFFLWLLIWTGAIMGLVESGNDFLAWLLLLSGIAVVYKEGRFIKRKGNKK